MDIKHINLQNATILDTETTGLGYRDEICEISVIDAETAEPLLNTLVKPKTTIPEEVIRIHGITNDMVVDAPDYSKIHNQLMSIFKEKRMIIYNAGFDLRMIRQSGSQLDFSGLKGSDTIICAMIWYAKFYGQWDSYRRSYKWQKLINAARQQNIDVRDLIAHRALADCVITQRVIKAVNGKI
ncbi:MAG: 3'-5' exonuclease [Gammaproteobacteria bacterium]|nr:3'-5' exonuclease [Gammaproteobacteria bacterium]